MHNPTIQTYVKKNKKNKKKKKKNEDIYTIFFVSDGVAHTAKIQFLPQSITVAGDQHGSAELIEKGSV